MQQAKYFKKLHNSKVQCILCPNNCIINPDQVSSCLSRVNVDGSLFVLNYGKTCSLAIDPIEKKPLYHFHPGSRIFSLGPNSCNLHCSFCQNYTISQMHASTRDVSPSQLLEICKERNVKSVAFTYSEPITWFEFIMDTAPIMKDNGISVVLVTNGYINSEPLHELLPYIDAMNIDLKSFNSEFYSTVCDGSIRPVLETIESSYSSTHLELTHLLIPDLNDNLNEFESMIDFIAGINKSIPLHISAYFPAFKMDNKRTPSNLILEYQAIAKNKLEYVYSGNIGAVSETICPNCGKLLIRRDVFGVKLEGIISNRCVNCNHEIYGEF